LLALNNFADPPRRRRRYDRSPMPLLARVVVPVALVAACGGPALQNVPKPDPSVVAGAAAAVAGAATLADPNGAAKRQEQKEPQKSLKPKKSGGTVPGDVLDRLDAKQQGKDAGTDETTEPTAPPDETSQVKSPVPLKHQ
jgi:hypothetical protein